MFFRVDDKLHSHVKAMRAGVEAVGLWTLAASWSASQLTDGWVPEYAALRLAPNAHDLASSLVRAGLWHEQQRDGEPGWQFHEWDEWQHTREYVQERQRRARERMQAVRERAQTVRANSARSAPNPKPKPNNPPNPPEGDETDAAFDAFWGTYPRKTSKPKARKSFERALDAADAGTIMAGLRAAVAAWQALNTEARFIPHPATWLNQQRWADEQPLPGVTQQQQRASVTLAQCDDRQPHVRHRWSDSRTEYQCMGVDL